MSRTPIRVGGDVFLCLSTSPPRVSRSLLQCTRRFISGFWYINAMGQVAYNGMDRLHRQDIAGWSFTVSVSVVCLCVDPSR